MAGRGGGRAGETVRDVLVWLLLTACTVLGNGIGRDGGASWSLTAAEAGVLAVAVAVLRRRPLAGWLLVAVLALSVNPGMVTLAPALAAASYLLGRRSARTRPALLAFGGAALLGTLGVVVQVGDAVRYADQVFGWLVMVATLLFGAAFPWIVGRYRRQAAALVRAGWERAERLEHEQRIVAAQAGLRERARIAEDMHDALGHDLSLIALRAGALQVAPDLPDAHRAAAAELRAEAAAATERLHEIIGVLREPGEHGGLAEHGGMGEAEAAGAFGGAVGPAAPAAPAAPVAPVGETLHALVDRAASSGLRARLVTAGGPARYEGLPPAVDRAAYRVVQEALTNAAKHAPGAEVTVTVEHADGAGAGAGAGARVSVVNGPPTRGPAPRARAGTGLIALRERVRLVGGGLRTGAGDDGGFVVTAWFPADGKVAGAVEDVEPAEAERSVAARQFAQGRQVARRWFTVASATVGVAAALVTTAVLGWYAYTTTESVLPVSAYDRLRIGDPEAEVRAGLPGREDYGPPTDRAPALPPGAACAYYRSSGDLFTSVDIYRLCFRDGRLIDKTVIERAGAER